MNIFIVGSTGRVGYKLTEALIKEGHTVFAGARDKAKVFEHDQVTPIDFDLHWDLTQMTRAMSDLPLDAIYFVAGSRGKDLLQSDLFGAVKVMQAAESINVKRFVQLSSIFALEPEKWTTSFLKNLGNYNVAKYFSDNWLINNTNLDYTILQPGALTEDAGTGLIDIQGVNPGSNSIMDVARTLALILNNQNTIKKVIKMCEGNIPVQEALQSV